MTRRRALLVPVVLACVLTGSLTGLVSGCGLAPQDEPTVVDPHGVPFGLGERRRSSLPAPALGAAHAPENVYFVVSDRLGGVPRGLTSDNPRERVHEVLRALADGPTPDEQRAGLSSAIPPDLRLRLTGLHTNVATIDLSGDADPSAEESPLTVAQIVLSVTSVASIDQVRLTRDRQPIPAPLVDGSLTSSPLTAFDYRPLRVELARVPGTEQLTGKDGVVRNRTGDGADPMPLDDDVSTPEPEPPPPTTEPEPGSEPDSGTDSGTDSGSDTDPESAPPEPESALSAQYMSSE